MLKAIIGVLAAGIFMLFLFAVADGVIMAINHSSAEAAQALNVTQKQEFQDEGNKVFTAVAWIAALVLAGIFIALGLHIKRR